MFKAVLKMNREGVKGSKKDTGMCRQEAVCMDFVFLC